MSLSDCQTFLDEHGLLLALLPLASLSPASGERVNADAGDTLLVFANVGRGFWEHLVRTTPGDIDARANPVDDHAITVTRRFADTFLADRQVTRLFPAAGDCPSLIELGRLAGWSQPSPLGLGLHPKHGPWLAYRAVMQIHGVPPGLVSWHRPATGSPAPMPAGIIADAGPCLQCAAPCQAACPGGAVHHARDFDIAACLAYRSTDTSACDAWCAARVACPVGRDSRYADAQLAYHMRRSLEGLRRWLARDPG